MQILIGHTSAETAHLTPDYPYGFRLRCQRREWLEYRKGLGYRMVTQTRNPNKLDRRGLVWNRPHPSIYQPLAVMYLDDEGYVQYASLSRYAAQTDVVAFEAIYGAGLQGEQEQTILAAWYRSFALRANPKQSWKIHDQTSEKVSL